jgi:hypothetical protein
MRFYTLYRQSIPEDEAEGWDIEGHGLRCWQKDLFFLDALKVCANFV